MGSPSAIVTLGLGSWGSVGDVVTLGYGSSIVVVTPITEVDIGYTAPRSRLDYDAQRSRLEYEAKNQ